MAALQVFANYTFSKSIDNVSAEGSGYSAPVDPLNFRLGRARSDWDRPHSFNASVIYNLPIGKGKLIGRDMPQWLDPVIGGWGLGGLVIWQSGGVFTVGSARATTHGGVNTWANYEGDRNIGDIIRKGDGVWYLTPEDFGRFSFPLAGEVGTSGRNSFRGPRFFNSDVSIVKKFRIYEGHAVSFRAEGYNIFNNTNFANPTVGLATPATFGKIGGTTSNNPRVFQIALRYDF